MNHAQGVMRNIAAFTRVPRGDFSSVLRMSLTAVFLPLLTKMMSLPSLLALLDAGGGNDRRGDPAHLATLPGKILARNIGPFKTNCYRRSMMLFRELRRRGWPATIVFGIRETKDVLDGHAWIELDGQALGEPEDPSKTFRVVYSYPVSRGEESS